MSYFKSLVFKNLRSKPHLLQTRSKVPKLFQKNIEAKAVLEKDRQRIRDIERALVESVLKNKTINK